MAGRPPRARWVHPAVVVALAVLSIAVGQPGAAHAASDPCTAGGNGLACAAQRLLTLVLPGEAPSPDTQFARLTYADTPAAADAQLQVAVVQAGSTAPGYVAALHAQSPGLKVLAYQSPWLRPAGDPSGLTTCLPGSGGYPAGWYLHTDSGKRELVNPGAPTAYDAMDFGNGAYLRACAAHAVAIARATGVDGIFLDGAATSVHWAQLPAPCATASATCSSDVAWQNAMAGALTYLAAILHAHGLLLIANISGGNIDYCCGGGPAVWRRYLTALDGALEESWTYGTDGRPLPAREVRTGLDNVAWDESHGKLTIVNDDVSGCAACITLGLATELLVAAGQTSYDVAAGAYARDPIWSADYAAAQRLGAPLGAYTEQPNGLLVRRFSAGLVVVNATGAPVQDPAFGVVSPHSGLIR